LYSTITTGYLIKFNIFEVLVIGLVVEQVEQFNRFLEAGETICKYWLEHKIGSYFQFKIVCTCLCEMMENMQKQKTRHLNEVISVSDNVFTNAKLAFDIRYSPEISYFKGKKKYILIIFFLIFLSLKRKIRILRNGTSKWRRNSRWPPDTNVP
jgi:hypothetical protein